MFGFFCLIIILLCVALVFFIIIQNSKGGGLASNFQGVSNAMQFFGSRRSAAGVEIGTWILAGTIAVFAILANFFLNTGNEPDAAENRLRSSQAIELQRPNVGATQAPDVNQIPSASGPGAALPQGQPQQAPEKP
jgi:preprotein translocase subunit SecG